MTFKTSHQHCRILSFNEKSVTLTIQEKDSEHVLKVYLYSDSSLYIVTPSYGITPKEMAELGYVINCDRKEIRQHLYSNLQKKAMLVQ